MALQIIWGLVEAIVLVTFIATVCLWSGVAAGVV